MIFDKIELSILNKNQEEIANVLKRYDIKHIHIDIMDGYFTKSLSNISPYYLEQLNLKEKKIHLHFMVNDVIRFINYYEHIKNIESISYHFETNIMIDKKYLILNKRLRKKGIKLGLVINPETSINEIKNIIKNFDFLLIMSVLPGKGGQSFIEKIGEKIIYFKKNFSNIPLYIDGGVNDMVYNKYTNYADRFIIGNYLFK